MSNIAYSFNLSMTAGTLVDTYSSLGLAVSQTNARLIRNIQDVGFAAHEPIDVGDLTEPGYAAFRNMDSLNYVQVGIDVSGTFYPFVKLMPLQQCLVRLGTTAPYAKANVAVVKLFYVMYDS